MSDATYRRRKSHRKRAQLRASFGAGETLYNVNVGGSIVELIGDENKDASFRLASSKTDLARLVREQRPPPTITTVLTRADAGITPMVWFYFNGSETVINALLVYLCARFHMMFTNRQLRNLLANHMQEHIDTEYARYLPASALPNSVRTYRDHNAFYKYRTSQHHSAFRTPGSRAVSSYHSALIQSFCDVFGLTVQMWDSRENREELVKGVRYRPNRLETYPNRHTDAPVNLYHPFESTCALLGTIDSSFSDS